MLLGVWWDWCCWWRMLLISSWILYNFDSSSIKSCSSLFITWIPCNLSISYSNLYFLNSTDDSAAIISSSLFIFEGDVCLYGESLFGRGNWGVFFRFASAYSFEYCTFLSSQFCFLLSNCCAVRHDSSGVVLSTHWPLQHLKSYLQRNVSEHSYRSSRSHIG